MPASAELCGGEYGEEGLFAGVPCVIGASGVEEVVELPSPTKKKPLSTRAATASATTWNI